MASARRLRTGVNRSLLVLAALLPWVTALPAAAQQPIGPELRVSRPSEDAKFAPRLLFGPDGAFVVAWSGFRSPPEPCPECSSIWQAAWRRFSASDQLLSEHLVEGMGIATLYPPALTRAGPDAYSVLTVESEQDGDSRLLERLLSWSTGETLAQRALLTSPFPEVAPDGVAARSPEGTLMVAGLGKDQAVDPECPGCEYGVFGAAFDEEGRVVRELFQVNPDSRGTQSVTGIAVDGQGRFLVTWWGNLVGGSSESDVFLRRYSPSGEPLGLPLRVNSRTEGGQSAASVAADLTGNFVVSWESFREDGSFDDIFGQRFSPSAERLGPEIRVNTTPAAGQYKPSVAMDRAGNFVVVWQSFPGVGHDFWDIKAQLFRKDGRRAGPEIFVNTYRLNYQEEPYVTFAENGTFGAVWKSFFQPPGSEDWDIYFQRFSASPGDEPCWVRGGQVFCDTGRTGGGAEIEMTFGGRPRETLLSGDYDGDGRADLCARYGTRFRCDLDHRGAPAEAKVDFGLADDTPLMGDLDGDGKAEACVRRRRQFLCDSSHDGGRPETRILFGLVSDTPLLGDLDGDGRDDPCLWRAGHFLCDTAHDGNGADLDIAFGQAGDEPVLGDLDGDGRDDPCVLRSGHLLCDTAHDGGAAAVDLLLATQAGDRPLIANLDAL